MVNHPLCEECLKIGKITPSVDCHHKISPFKNGDCNMNLLLDDNNLMALCTVCHGSIHANQQGHKTAEQLIKILEELMDDNTDDN